MANHGNNDFIGNQKKRNFIYNPGVNVAAEKNSLPRQTGVGTKSSTCGRVSPRKRFRTSHGAIGKRVEEIAAEEIQDLPPDAFDEELVGVEDDFEDDILTAEQLDECDRIVSLELQSQHTTHKRKQPNVSHTSLSGLSSNVNDSSSKESLLSHGYPERAVSAHFAGGLLSNSRSSRDRDISSRHSPFISHPQEEFGVKSRSDHVLNSIINHSGESVSLAERSFERSDSRMDTRWEPIARNNGTSFPQPLNDALVQSLRKEIEKFKTETAVAKSKVKTLEEEKFSRDGEIKILRDSLEHFQAEEKRRQEEAKATQDQRAREQSDREKKLEKQVENLTTQLQFKEREVSQMIEQNKKVAASLAEGSPHKKSANLSKVFPTGSSFFQNSSPEGKAKSPKVKQNTKEPKFKNKESLQRLSESENSENASISGASTASSVLRQTRAQKREAEAVERNLIQCKVQCLPEIELVLKLLSHEEKELPCFVFDHESGAANDSSILSLLKLDESFVNSIHLTQRTTLDDTIAPHTLCLFETQSSTRLQRSSNFVSSNESSEPLNCDTALVTKTLFELLNRSQSSLSLDASITPTPFSKPSEFYTAINVLPLLEYHILRYVEQRTKNTDDNIVSTCIPRNSPSPDSPDPMDTPGSENEQVKKLLILQHAAIISLKLLNVLVLYSNDVQEHILKSARVLMVENDVQDANVEGKNREDEFKQEFSYEGGDRSYSQHPLFSELKIAIRKNPSPDANCPESLMGKENACRTPEQAVDIFGYEQDVIQRTELLSCLFKLLVAQPKESANVAYITLQVFVSLAKNCEDVYYPRLSPLLSDGLLGQCLSRDWSLRSLSLVTLLLTSLTDHYVLVKKFCSQSDDCLLQKIFQGWIYKPDDVPSIHHKSVCLQIVDLVNNLLSKGNPYDLLFPMESECHCSLELIKCLVLMLDKELTILDPLSVELLISDVESSYSLMLVRQGVFLLTTLSVNDRLFVEHRVEVERVFVNVVGMVTRLYKRISHLLSEIEVLAVQDLVDFEHIDGIEWTQESEDSDDETAEGMEVDG